MSVRTRVVARTIDLDPSAPVDLLAFAGRDGLLWWQGDAGLACRGEALRIELPNGLSDPRRAAEIVRDALAQFDVADEVRRPATGPVALGALPFDRDAAGAFVVPEVLVGRSRDGRQWMTAVGVDPGDVDVAAITSASAPEGVPDGFRLTTPIGHAEFKEKVAAAVDAIAAGPLEKVVLAREVVVETNRPIDVVSVLERLHALYPSCTVFSVDGFIGASPELLLERRGDRVRSHPLAGTFPRSGDPDADEVLATRLQQSTKDRSEHRFVIDELDRALRPRCEELDVPDVPTILPLRNVLHLGTEIAGRLRDPLPSALELVGELHPTPAVGGTPTAQALEWLRANEGLERGRYAGPVGWVDGEGDGSFVIGIRSAEVDASVARLFAGVGIVAGSDPEAELVETQLKLQALLAALVRP
ncbi:MAG TPA: isochorismate synthase [Acidimicrobiales bacterium]|nr:isochorismate synthase [Acidimicrobiales bacterium]